MGILDKGDQTVVIIPSEPSPAGRYDDSSGDTATRRPSETERVTVERVFMLPVSATEDSSAGQSTTVRYQLVGRIPDIDGFDAYAEVEWPPGSGQRLDVIGQPIKRTYPPRLAHTSVLLQLRAS